MKIVHLIDYFQPKLGYQETFLAREHMRMGHDVCVITSNRYNPSLYSGGAGIRMLGDRIINPGFFTEEGIKVWRLPTLFELPHAIWMRSLDSKIQELKPDIVIVHGIVSFQSIRIALKKKRFGFKLIYDDHMTSDNSRSKLKVLYLLFRWSFAFLIRKAADSLIAVSQQTKVFMHNKYGFPNHRIKIIPLGADEELFRYDPTARQEIRKQLFLHSDDVVFIYTGKIIPEKRLDLLIKAVPLIRKFKHLRVLLVGSGPEGHINYLRNMLKAENITSMFILRNHVHNKNLFKFYSAADVAVWPRGASISQREAMSCSLPIIISHNSMVTDLVNYNNGLVCKENDASDLAQQMEMLLDPELRRTMGTNSRRYVEEKLNWKIIAQQFLEVVEK